MKFYDIHRIFIHKYPFLTINSNKQIFGVLRNENVLFETFFDATKNDIDVSCYLALFGKLFSLNICILNRSIIAGFIKTFSTIRVDF